MQKQKRPSTRLPGRKPPLSPDREEAGRSLRSSCPFHFRHARKNCNENGTGDGEHERQRRAEGPIEGIEIQRGPPPSPHGLHLHRSDESRRHIGPPSPARNEDAADCNPKARTTAGYSPKYGHARRAERSRRGLERGVDTCKALMIGSTMRAGRHASEHDNAERIIHERQRLADEADRAQPAVDQPLLPRMNRPSIGADDDADESGDKTMP